MMYWDYALKYSKMAASHLTVILTYYPVRREMGDQMWYMIWYICHLQLGSHPVAVVQYTFTHKQYIKQHKWQQNNTNNN
jgi:beta-lactamase regulating signal transducer with metallopeptidase domain